MAWGLQLCHKESHESKAREGLFTTFTETQIQLTRNTEYSKKTPNLKLNLKALFHDV